MSRLSTIKEIAGTVKDGLKKISKLITGIGLISLWILLLALILIYLIIRRYIKLRDQLSGYENREDKIAAIERLKRASRKANFFERIVDKGAIALTKKLGKQKTKRQKH